jgi:hypothetical protein
MKRRLGNGFRLLIAGGVLGMLAIMLTQAPSRTQASYAAPLLEKVQALGNLHVVKYTYRDIKDFQTSREPVAWLSSVPGGRDLVASATRNRTTLSYTGAVEAGIDLTQATIRKSATGLELILPQPVIYRPNVAAQVHDLKRGLFWRDENIVPTAIEQAKDRLQDTARRQGILGEARENARTRVESLARELGAEVQVSFVEG